MNENIRIVLGFPAGLIAGSLITYILYSPVFIAHYRKVIGIFSPLESNVLVSINSWWRLERTCMGLMVNGAFLVFAVTAGLSDAVTQLAIALGPATIAIHQQMQASNWEKSAPNGFQVRFIFVDAVISYLSFVGCSLIFLAI
ncbi:MAG: hypothetical protein ABL936_22650 [Aestuariivirga sp.]